jgi:hypothetical protein
MVVKQCQLLGQGSFNKWGYATCCWGDVEDKRDNRVSSVQKSVKKRVGRELPFRQNLIAEAEESLLLEAITREGLAKIQKAKKDLAGFVVICKVWRLAVRL